jgi:predicted dehydrogenase
MDLGILGCGAITRNRHLPAILAHPEVRVALLVDSDLERADLLRRSHGLDCPISANFRDVLNYKLECVLNALPNHLHASVNLELLRGGVHVLCEKPLATTAEEVRVCCEASEQIGVVLAAAMTRRFYGSTMLLNLALREGLLGSVLGYTWEHGVPFSWNTASGYNFFREQAGGGVLLDEGIHLLDCLTYWFGSIKCFDYQDDNWGGGIEANVILDLRHADGERDVLGRVRMSRTYTLKNRLLVQGTRAHAEISRQDPNVLVLYHKIAAEEVSMTLRLADPFPKDPFFAQLDNFVKAVQGLATPIVSGRQSLETIELVQRCYSRAKRIPEPWFDLDAKPLQVSR